MKFSAAAASKAQPPIAAENFLARATLIAARDRLRARRLGGLVVMAISDLPINRLHPKVFRSHQWLAYRFDAGVVLPTLRSLTTSVPLSMSTRTTPYTVTCHHQHRTQITVRGDGIGIRFYSCCPTRLFNRYGPWTPTSTSRRPTPLGRLVAANRLRTRTR
jgi:hypothetical protein